MSEPTSCELCGQPAPPGRRYCSDDHMGQAQRGAVDRSSPLAIFLDKELRQRRMTIEALARELGTGGPTLTRWIHGYWRDGKRASCLPGQPNWDRLKAYFGDELPELQNATQLRSERMRPWAHEVLQRPDVRKKSVTERAKTAAEQRGMKRPAISQAGRERHQRDRDAGIPWNLNPDFGPMARTQRGRLQRTIGRYLTDYPSATVDELREHLRRVAEREGLGEGDAWSTCDKVLRAHGVRMPGRPLDEPLHDKFALRQEEWDAMEPADRKAAGGSFYRWAAGRIWGRPQDDQRLKKWWSDHRRICGRVPATVLRDTATAATSGLLTVPAAAERMGCSPTSVKRLIARGVLPARKLRAVWWLDPHHVDAAAEQLRARWSENPSGRKTLIGVFRSS
jgi:hypothetical protein